MAINYVRFQRGTLAAYQALLEKGSIDENTLYFIYGEDDSSVGSLYLGERVISGGDTNYVFSTLDELSDVDVANAESGSFLVKDSTTDNWVAKTPIQVAELIQEYINNEPVINLDSDNLSVEILDNVIQLKNYGTSYYRYIPAVKDSAGNITEESKYVLTDGFKAGLEPRVEETTDGLVLSWYEPNNEKIENLEAEIANIENSILDIETAVSSLQNVVNGENGLNNQVNELIDLVGTPATNETEASGLHKGLEDLEALLNTKANASDTYKKTEIDAAIAAAVAGANHLQRKIVNSKEEIDIAAEDAHLFIYMVPTGLQYEDDKYDEYVIIDGILEKVGSWEVDLTNYVTKDEIIIKSVSNDFIIDENKQLLLNNLSTDKITGLQDALNNKVDKVEGYTLLSPEDKAKLDKLVISDEGDLEVSGTVNASNVVGLETWLNEHADSVKGLSENNLTDDLYEKLSNLLFITSVNEDEFTVKDGKLELLTIDQNKVTGLVDALNAKASQESINTINNTIDAIQNALTTYQNKVDSHDLDIENIKDILTWKDM